MPRDPAKTMRQSARWSRWAKPPPVAPEPTRGNCRLTFTLPNTLVLVAKPGPVVPCLMGCLVTVGRNGYVIVDGKSREGVFDQATVFLRSLIRELRRVGNLPPRQIITAALQTAYRLQPQDGYCGDLPRGGRDTWHIVIEADVAFSPCAVEPWLPGKEEPVA